MNSIIKKGSFIIDYIVAHYKTITLALAISLGLSGIYLGFAHYQQYRLEKGYEQLATIQKYLDTEVGRKTKFSDLEAIQFNTSEEKWTAVEREALSGIQNYGSTKLKGLFTAFQAHAALALNKKNEAITLYHAAGNSISDKSLALQYQLSAALLELDMPEKAASGLALLKDLAEQKQYPVHALALYYLGEYAWTQSDYTTAQNYWSQLVISAQSDKQLIDLGLIKKAKTKLKLMKAA